MIKKVFGILLVVLAVYAVMLLTDAGAFKTIVDQGFGQCSKVGKIAGPEDMAIVPNSHFVVISSDAREPDKKDVPGDLFLYDMERRELQANNISSKMTVPFHPHGLDLISSPNGIGTLLYVVNHRSESETSIEVFKIVGDQIQFVKSLQSPDFINGNDLSLVGEDHFYLTNDFDTSSRLKQEIQKYSRVGSGRLIEYDHGENKKIADHLFFANGNALSPDKKSLYVVEMLGRKLHVLSRQGTETKLEKTVDLGLAVDNVTVWDNSLILAVHPKLLKLKSQSADHSDKAPSQIWKLDLDHLDGKPQLLYSNSGSDISSSSVGLMLSKSRLLIGSVFDDHIFDCDKGSN